MKIRDDLEGVVYVRSDDGTLTTLKAGDTVPSGIEVGDHLAAPVNRGGRPRKSDAGDS